MERRIIKERETPARSESEYDRWPAVAVLLHRVRSLECRHRRRRHNKKKTIRFSPGPSQDFRWERILSPSDGFELSSLCIVYAR